MRVCGSAWSREEVVAKLINGISDIGALAKEQDRRR